jgi:glycosyltransferase involved in cell wall biosynthesis
MDKNLNTKPLVSITICTYNRADMISKAIQSALEQTYENIEIIVVDDASTDNTEVVVKSIQSEKIKYFKNPKNLNIAGTRNNTVKYSNGKYIAILDSDDYWIDNEKIEKQVKFLEQNNECALVGSSATQIDKRDGVVGEIKNLADDESIKNNLLVRNEFVHSTVLYRKKVIEEFGLFDKNKSPFEDYDLILKIGRKYKLANINEKTTAYRVHLGGESKKLNLKKKLIFLGIILKNLPFYKNGFKGIRRRLNL